MAHIKVVRRSMRPEEWTDLRFGWLKRYIYEEKYEIETLMVRDARQVSEMQYDYYPDSNKLKEYRVLRGAPSIETHQYYYNSKGDL